MTKYINADKFLKSMITKFKCVPLLGVSKYINGEEYFEGEHLNSLINETPTADVVEVVRCKDCKHATFYSCKNDACYKGIICEYQIAIGDENFFCACGEARTPKERDMEK